MNTDDVLQFTAEMQKQKGKVALITITGVTGSTPAGIGQMMAVTSKGESVGTVGGGAAEHALKQKAVQAIEEGKAFFTFSFELSETGMVCGGTVSGFGNVFGIQHRVVIFGGGHIARCIAPIAAVAGFDVTIVEERAEMESFFSGSINANVRFILSHPGEYEDKISLDKNTYVVITTYGHQADQAALNFCINKDLAYLGMIGSKRKIEVIKSTLDFSEKVVKHLYAPIGLDIASEKPGEIAVGIVAEILAVKNKGILRHKKDGEYV
ncbi:MAG: XdhC/CoxI family protein [Defluviitaleaceae bacterium]|nr:XdhC/CoxI family protein [Defluviitaleaceae bacterium]